MVARPSHAWTSTLRPRDHRHAFHELAVVIEGTCHWRLGGRFRVELNEGEILLLAPQRLHREEIPAGASARLLWIGFTLEHEVDYISRLLDQPRSAAAWANDLETLGDMLYREHQHPELPGSPERVDGLLRALLATLHRIAVGADAEKSPSGGRHDAALRAAARTLRCNLAQPPRVSELARQHGLTPDHFATLFTAAHGLAPRPFLQRARIEEAQRRLRVGAETVKEIAAACGYAGAPHFCRAFKNTTGLSPRVWRSKAAKETEPGLPS